MTVSDGPTAAEQFLARRDIYGVGRGWLVCCGWRGSGPLLSSGRYPGAKLCPTVACRQTPIDRRGRSVRFIGFVGYSFHTSARVHISARSGHCAGRIHFRVVVHCAHSLSAHASRLARTEDDLHLDEVYTLVERT